MKEHICRYQKCTITKVRGRWLKKMRAWGNKCMSIGTFHKNKRLDSITAGKHWARREMSYRQRAKRRENKRVKARQQKRK